MENNMQLKEKMHSAINQMNVNELILLYEHVKLLTEIKHTLTRTVTDIPIEKILDMTSSSTSCWSDTIIQERADQV